jgi:hypothetical protein
MFRRIHPWFAILTILIFSGFAWSDIGYRMDYDYPDQGDDWYGSSAGPDSRRDYPAIELDQSWNGNDFGAGYDRLTDPYGFGPSLDLLIDRHSAYALRFGNQEFYGWECWGDCGSGSWCSFPGDCITGRCVGGGSRSCSDGNDCTEDVCNASLQRCEHPYVSPPGRVTNLMLSKPAPGSMVATLSWDDRHDEEWYNVYRGENPWLDDLACYEPGIVGTSVDDDGTVGVTGMYVLLITADHHCNEGQLGVSSDYQLRFNTNPCP